jgi:hypothetical protein
MSVWEAYPTDYRRQEVDAIRAATVAGECVSVVGLSGAGKSNLLGFIASRTNASEPDREARFFLVDCNRLPEFTGKALFHLARATLGDNERVDDEFQALNDCLGRLLADPRRGLCLMLDRFDCLGLDENATPLQPPAVTLASNLRALRDGHKYALSLVTATRRLLNPHSELAELFYANTLWLGPLSENDARWNIRRFARRHGLEWEESAVRELIRLTGAYPSFLKAACEGYAAGCALEAASLAASQPVQRCLDEFWADQPELQALRRCGLEGHPLLQAHPSAGLHLAFDSSHLTAKENLLLNYLSLHPGQVCEKDDLIRAVWPEDRIYQDGIRDDSLAQLVRRLREKIEPDPSNPRHLQTVPGRGYRFQPQSL